MKIDKLLLRMIDANFNRSREGLRVCEDICRFTLGQQKEATELKAIRHSVTDILKTFSTKELLAARDVAGDEGRAFDKSERNRSGWSDVYFANLQRSKEALRVLEEAVKLHEPSKAGRLKKLRFRLYDHEKKIHHRF